jgi:hypothetical protein
VSAAARSGRLPRAAAKLSRSEPPEAQPSRSERRRA